MPSQPLGAVDPVMVDWTELGRIIASARNKRGQTQAELGKDAGLGRSQISNIERGWNTTTHGLERVVKAVGLELAVDIQEPGAGVGIPKEVLSIASKLASMPPEDRQLLLELIDAWDGLPDWFKSSAHAQWPASISEARALWRASKA